MLDPVVGIKGDVQSMLKTKLWPAARAFTMCCALNSVSNLIFEKALSGFLTVLYLFLR